uniref:Uncharacterized protein n=1 Tax=Rhizophora mucronata TaxID=61149 RepID=A0A2P2PPJ4_RHIMU
MQNSMHTTTICTLQNWNCSLNLYRA